MHKHLLSCCKALSKRPLQQGQSTLKYQKVPKQALPKGLNIATKLIYQDHIPIYTVAGSEVQKMNVEVKAVLTKWLTDNPIVEALIRKRGDFFDMMEDRLICEGYAENDHLYNLDNDITFEDFSKKVTEEDFRIENYMKSFRPASVDPERLFSLCRYSKNYLQNRMTAENHARNVFITKNTQFLPRSV